MPGSNVYLSACVATSCLAVVCGIVWLGVGVGVVRPVWYISTFQEGSCRTERYFWAGDKVCDCGSSERTYTDHNGQQVTERDDCWSYFPCVQIYVTLTTRAGIKYQHRFLHWSETDLFNSYYKECGTSTCNEYAHSNSRYVNRFRVNYGVIWSQYSCLYNPQDTSEVIAIRYFHKSAVFHGLFWPGLFFGIFLIAAVISGICYKCRR